MSLPLILQPGEGRTVQIRTSTCTFNVTGNDTYSHFGLFEFVMEPETEGCSFIPQTTDGNLLCSGREC